MTVLGSLNVQCRHCGETSEQTAMVSTSTLGGRDLDLRPAEMKRSTTAASSEPVVSAWADLEAAWVCDDAGLTGQAVDARRYAAESFRRLPASSDLEQRYTFGAVLVDVLRRSGQMDAARAEC
jgi:hypothetical protein